ncbi:MAG: SAM-dependent methyltransferase [Segniliparus sp.]|uniref:SAM-dependent methyltransferase n=1 Tax=Segniliparus sp. TaxID=2804064 RepID=UPI003F3E0CC1
MARTDGDDWDLSESVGVTALGVAAGRAAETASEHPLVKDPYAQLLVDGVPNNPLAKYTSGTLMAELAKTNPLVLAAQQAMQGYLASRTKFFDDFFLDSARAGARQAVILASGLDARAWRLDWPEGTRVFELDLPRVLAYKSETLARHGAKPSAALVEVPVDLRDDWPKALVEAGFDPEAPSAWSAEGLLPYLPGPAQDLLFERIAALAAPGSRVAIEAFDPAAFGDQAQQQWQQTQEQMKEHGLDFDIKDLVYLDDERAEPVAWFAGRGWAATSATAAELMASNGRAPDPQVADTTPKSYFVTATKG